MKKADVRCVRDERTRQPNTAYRATSFEKQEEGTIGEQTLRQNLQNVGGALRRPHSRTNSDVNLSASDLGRRARPSSTSRCHFCSIHRGCRNGHSYSRIRGSRHNDLAGDGPGKFP